MLALRSSIQQGFTTALNTQRAAIDDLGECIDHAETKLAEYSIAHNTLVDAHQLEDDMKSLAAKLADLEDRNMRNNIKLQGIP